MARDPAPQTKLRMDTISFLKKLANSKHSQFPDKSCRYCGTSNRKEHSPNCEHMVAKRLLAQGKELYATV